VLVAAERPISNLSILPVKVSANLYHLLKSFSYLK
jgi:hypothetical protein